MPSTWVKELRSNLREYKENLNKRGLGKEKFGVTSDRMQRLKFLEDTIGLEEEMLPPNIKFAQNPYAGDDLSISEKDSVGVQASILSTRDKEKKEADEYKRQYSAYLTRQRQRDAAVLELLNKLDNPNPPYHEVTDKNREKFYHRVCQHAMTGDQFGGVLTKTGRDGKPSALYGCLDKASKKYTAQLESDHETTQAQEQKLQRENEQTSRQLATANGKISTLETEKRDLGAQVEQANNKLATAQADLEKERQAVKNQRTFMSQDQRRLAEQEKQIADLEKRNTVLAKENTQQVKEIAALKETNQGLRARFFNFITSFLGYLHNEKNIKITGEGAFDDQKASDMVEEYRAKTLASRKQAAAKTSGKPTESTSSSFFDSAWATLFGSSEAASASSSTKHVSKKSPGTTAVPTASHAGHGKGSSSPKA